MPLTDERLIAYVDGELDTAGRAEVEAAAGADPDVAARLKAHQGLRERLFGTYAGTLGEPIPHAWIELVSDAAPDATVDLARERARRRPTAGWTAWAAMAACLAAGLYLGRLVLPVLPPGLITESDAAMVARGPLDRALTDQLASAQGGGPIRIGLSFRSRDNHLCRTFQAAADGGLAGLACRDGDRWQVRLAVAHAPASQTQYQAAASQTPPAVLNAVDETILGDPMDARAEAAARARGWRP